MMPKDRPDPVRDDTGRTRPASPAIAPVPTEGNTADAQPPVRRRRRLRWLLMILGPVAVLAGAGYLYVTGGRYASTDDAYLKADVGLVAPEVAGLITEVAIHENQHVKKGEVLFRVDARRYRIALAAADANLSGVRDQIAVLKATYRQKQEELALAQANIAFAQSEFDRYSKLVTSSAVSRSSYDSANHDLAVAKHNARVTEQEIAQIRAQLAGDPEIPVERHPSYLQAEAERDQAALDLEQTVVRAPFAGIASNTPQIGQQVTGNGALSTPVMSVVADSGLWIEANFKESELTDVRAGQPVSITVDAYPAHSWRGVVQSIGPATGAEFSVIPAQNATGNWVKVVQRIPVRIAVTTAPDDPVLRAGMSAVVVIDTGRTRVLPSFLRTLLATAGLLHASAGAAPQ